MSSNLELKRICQHCGKEYFAKKTSTKFCSLQCGQRNYKVRQRMNKVESRNAEAREEVIRPGGPVAGLLSEQGFVDIRKISFITSMSVRMIYRLMKEPEFPRIKIGRRLLFDKKLVLEYLIRRYGNW